MTATFSRPELLTVAALAVLLVSLGLTAQWRRSLRLVAALGGSGPAGRLTPTRLERLPVGRLVALALAVAALGVAAAGPRLAEPDPITPDPLDLVVTVDMSLSMATEDVGTSRTARANLAVIRLAEELRDERLGLDVFASWPYTLVPPTGDPAVVTFFGATLGPGAVGDRDQGTTLTTAIRHAREALELRRRPEAQAGILLISDGEGYEERDSVLEAVAEATDGGVRLWVAAVGTAEGAVLTRPGSTGEPLLDEGGQPVTSQLDGALLRAIADAGGGSYHEIGTDLGMAGLVESVAGAGGRSEDAGERPAPWLLLAMLALPLLLLEGLADARRAGAMR